MSERIFTVHPKDDDDLVAAAIAQRILDSPAFIESHRKAMRLASRHIAAKLARGEAADPGTLAAAIKASMREEA